jgi:imidazolonepropionase-like amidohydrolase
MSRGKIVSVVADGTATSSGSVTTIDAHGKFVVPGFNDMHAHVLGPPNPTNMLTLMLVNPTRVARDARHDPHGS